jgi:hypothetical protein
MVAMYGSAGRADLSIIEGNPIFGDPANRAQGKLRPTEVDLVTYGSKPLTYAQLLKVVRTMQPVAGDQQQIGGMATCTQADFGDVLSAGMPKGEVLVSVDEFRCDNGWALSLRNDGRRQGPQHRPDLRLRARGAVRDH